MGSLTESVQTLCAELASLTQNVSVCFDYGNELNNFEVSDLNASP
jgi:hypothetical protein